MIDIAIKVENLGKRYRLNSHQYRPETLGRAIFNSIISPIKSIWNPKQRFSEKDSLWALRHVSFEVKQGEVLGVLGPNGAGKSTLLRILSRVTLPTEGRADIYGRVGSLLQIGTGFNYELTGRENIYLNGTILGMKKSEIDRKFDEIIDFSGVEQFIDTPIKRFSSGMIVRLGFSVAICLNPDILLVDEVLSVGDAAFRKKSLDKVFNLLDQGCAVLFVSHDLFMIQRLCQRSILLEKGNVIENTDTSDLIEQYLSKITNILSPGKWIDLSNESRRGAGKVRFKRMMVKSTNEGKDDQAHSDGPIEFLLEVESDSPRSISGIAVTLFDLSGFRLINAGSMQEYSISKGKNRFRVSIKNLHLKPGTYQLDLWMVGPAEAIQDQIQSAAYLNVVSEKDSTEVDINKYQDKVTSNVNVSMMK